MIRLASARWGQFVSSEVGFVTTKSHNNRKRWADWTSLPIVEHLENLPLSSLHVETLATMLGVVENHDAGGDDNLVTRLHGRPFKSGDSLTESQIKALIPGLTQRLRAVFNDAAIEIAAPCHEGFPRSHPLADACFYCVVQ